MTHCLISILLTLSKINIRNGIKETKISKESTIVLPVYQPQSFIGMRLQLQSFMILVCDYSSSIFMILVCDSVCKERTLSIQTIVTPSMIVDLISDSIGLVRKDGRDVTPCNQVSHRGTFRYYNVPPPIDVSHSYCTKNLACSVNGQ